VLTMFPLSLIQNFGVSVRLPATTYAFAAAVSLLLHPHDGQQLGEAPSDATDMVGVCCFFSRCLHCPVSASASALAQAAIR
jgi:hypothetical protein